MRAAVVAAIAVAIAAITTRPTFAQSGSPAPSPRDPAGWVPAAIVGGVIVATWIWAYVVRRRYRDREG